MTTIKEMAERAGASGEDALRAAVLASCLTQMLKDADNAVAGAALGLALGDWVKGYGPVLKDQEKALDRVLAIAAARASNAK